MHDVVKREFARDFGPHAVQCAPPLRSYASVRSLACALVPCPQHRNVKHNSALTSNLSAYSPFVVVSLRSSGHCMMHAGMRWPACITCRRLRADTLRGLSRVRLTCWSTLILRLLSSRAAGADHRTCNVVQGFYECVFKRADNGAC